MRVSDIARRDPGKRVSSFKIEFTVHWKSCLEVDFAPFPLVDTQIYLKISFSAYFKLWKYSN
jgi:hypothetical protein